MKNALPFWLEFQVSVNGFTDLEIVDNFIAFVICGIFMVRGEKGMHNFENVA